MRVLRIITACSALALIAPLPVLAGGNLIEFRTVALTGQQAPGAPDGVSYSDLSASAPLLNASGKVAFLGTVAGPGVSAANGKGLWSDRSGSLGMVLREGDQAAGAAPGVAHVFPFGTTFRFNNAGHTAIGTILTGTGVTSSNNRAISTESSGLMAITARSGSQAPGLAAGVVYSDLSLSFPFTHAGKVAFSTSLSGPGVNSSNAGAVFSDRGGTMSKVVRSGEVAPGQPSGQTLPYLGFSGVVLNTQGSIGFASAIQGFPSNQGAVYTDRSGTMSRIAPPYGEVTHPAMNETGVVTFHDRINNVLPGGLGISYLRYSPTASSIGQAMAPVPPVPGMSHTGETNFHSPTASLNSLGDVAFFAAMYQFTPPNTSFFQSVVARQINGVSSLIAAPGQQAPDAAPDEVFASFSGLTLNDNRNLLFAASLTGPSVTSDNNSGLWMCDAAGDVSLILRKGDVFDVNDDPLSTDFRTISGFGYQPDGGRRDSGMSAFSNNNELAISLRFTDGSSGIFVIAVPAPGSAALLGVAGVVGLRRRRG